MKYLTALRRKLANGEFGPEDLFKIAARPESDTVSCLETVRDELPPDSVDLPWFNVAIEYVRDGCVGMKRWSTNKEKLYYALSFAGEVKTRESLAFLLWLSQEIPKTSNNQEFANAVNLLLSFKGAPLTTSSERDQLETSLLRGLSSAKGDEATANYYCALRGVGSRRSLELLESSPDLSEPYDSVRKLAINAVKKRLR